MSQSPSSARWPVAITCSTYDRWGSSRSLITGIAENGLDFISGRGWTIGDALSIAFSLRAEEPAIHVECAVCEVTAIHTKVIFLDLRHTDRQRIIGFLHDEFATIFGEPLQQLPMAS